MKYTSLFSALTVQSEDLALVQMASYGLLAMPKMVFLMPTVAAVTTTIWLIS
jgi:hypothetical protein